MFYFVSGPIGNLSDLTLRAKQVLEGVDYILAEDTRQTGKILARYNIDKRVVSFNQYSDHKIQGIVRDLQLGQNIALLSDAGTPGLCDPGGKISKALLQAGLKFSSVPGPSALTALISLAPFDCSRFTFLGYFPKKKGRNKLIQEIAAMDEPVFFFESPHRICKTLELISGALPCRNILIGRELTKKFEEIIYLNLGDLDVSKLTAKGEFVLAIEPLLPNKTK